MLTLLLALLALTGDEKKSVEVVCPVDGQRFTGVEVTATNHWGGRDTDGCPHAFKTTPLESLVWVCPGCHFAGRKADFQVKLTDEQKAALKGGLKAPVPLPKGAKQAEIPGWVKYDLMAQTAQARKQPEHAVALVWQHAAWSARQQGVTDFRDFEEWESLKQSYNLLQTPMVYGLAKNRTELDLDVARRVDKDITDRKYEKGANRILARYLSAFLWRKHGELREAERALLLLEPLKGENSVVDEAGQRLKESLARERDYLGRARESWKRAHEGAVLETKDKAPAAYLVGEFSRRLGDFPEAALWLQKAIDTSESPSLKKLAGDQRARLP